MFSILNTNKWLIVALICVFTSLCDGKDRSVRILYFQSPDDAPTEAFVYVGKKMVAETKLPRSNFSETFEIPRGDLELSFHAKPISKSDSTPSQAPVVKISKKWEKILLVVVEDKTNSIMPIKVAAIDASDRVFAGGSVYISNASEIDVFGTVGDREVELKPGSVQVVENPINDDEYYPAMLFCASGDEAKPRRFVRQMWNHDKSIRRVLLILPKETSPYVSYYSTAIRDF